MVTTLLNTHPLSPSLSFYHLHTLSPRFSRRISSKIVLNIDKFRSLFSDFINLPIICCICRFLQISIVNFHLLLLTWMKFNFSIIFILCTVTVIRSFYRALCFTNREKSEGIFLQSRFSRFSFRNGTRFDDDAGFDGFD